MTLARHETVDEDEVGTYHCTSRCVRRAHLCGVDDLTGKSFEHRRGWIRDRLSVLAQIFAVDVLSYAVLNNHLHTVLTLRPDLAAQWSAEEVARRWRQLFPLRRRKSGIAAEASEGEIKAITQDTKLVACYRRRLASLSWFNRCLKENIARRANSEDDCTGHFWEGRFHSTRVLSLSGILATAVYVDLNLIRAGVARTLEESDYTSIQDRLTTEPRII